MAIDLMTLHRRTKGSTSPVLLMRYFPKDYIGYPDFNAVPQDAYELWFEMQPKKVQRIITNRSRERIKLRTYLSQCGYNEESSTRHLIRNHFLEKNGEFPSGSRYGDSWYIYLPIDPKIEKHFTEDKVPRYRPTTKKVPLEEALFLCDSSLTLEEAKERIKALKLTSKVSIKGDSWKVPADLPYDL